ncbi:hypothetical protein ACWT_0606 [Actinoplanes sp. SE50]|nr:hypothetical protein ACPL_723 [Actinoplanes sp. SE50/110]ATO80021.1 hypothetical protein ACWT_0606 [Actinoplanes sp. SE50]SLL97425.1 hypothetical protein ACSP50_0628 [Actinoplanes sp. SE50/110]
MRGVPAAGFRGVVPAGDASLDSVFRGRAAVLVSAATARLRAGTSAAVLRGRPVPDPLDDAAPGAPERPASPAALRPRVAFTVSARAVFTVSARAVFTISARAVFTVSARAVFTVSARDALAAAVRVVFVPSVRVVFAAPDRDVVVASDRVAFLAVSVFAVMTPLADVAAAADVFFAGFGVVRARRPPAGGWSPKAGSGEAFVAFAITSASVP